MKNKVYIISCADWTTISEGKNSEEASTKGFESMIKTKGKDLKVSGVVQSICLTDIMEDFDLDQYIELTSCSRVMSNAGFHDTARMLTEILDK